MRRTRSFQPSLLPLVAASLLAVDLAAQGDCLDQSFLPIPNNGLEVTSNQSVTQTFTVGVAGVLSRIEIAGLNHHRGTATAPLDFAIVTTSGGVPTGTVLASATFQPNEVPSSRGSVVVDVTAASIVVVPGDVLGIRLSSAAAPGGSTYAWWGEAPGSYARGAIFVRGSTGPLSFDLSFQSFVRHPASSAAYGAGHAGTLGIPALSIAAPPVIGTNATILIGNSGAGATQGALFAGFQRQSLPTPFGGTLLVQIVADVTIAIPASGASVVLPIPPDPAACGLLVDFQAVMIDGGASHGIAFTRGLELELGR